MADAKISALTELTTGNIASSDLLPIVDVSDTTDAATGTTKKTLLSSLLAYIRANLTAYVETPSGAINGSNVSYTTVHTMNTVLAVFINGQMLHPSDYSYTGTTLTMVSPLDASLSGSPFTVVYL